MFPVYTLTRHKISIYVKKNRLHKNSTLQKSRQLKDNLFEGEVNFVAIYGVDINPINMS